MATILLQAAGAAIGGLFGSAGAAIGTAAGALAGYMIDQSLIGGSRHLYGARLAATPPLAAEEGQAIPRLYGTARLGATILWTTRFEEVTRTQRQGGKGSGPKVTTYSYFANIALGLCEGEIAHVRRVWADGVEIDRDQIEMRVYRGTVDQMPDPLIEAKQGAGNAPAYRGMAYVVLEHFALESYGNRIPQFQFEVVRPVGRLHEALRAMALVPGSTEYGLSPAPVTRRAGQYWSMPANMNGGKETLNRAIAFAPTDLAASLDELQALCPNLEHVALVISWFGDDLRAGHCTLRPRIVHGDAPEASQGWKVSGMARMNALEVSRHEGKPAYGGTPSDLSVMEAIRELKARGLKVTLYPFLMMDIPADNVQGQPAYPWRGRITSEPALAVTAVTAFCGTAAAGQFSAASDTIHFTGPANDWGYRRMILHYARLAVAAGGVDAFLIGSELRGLTTLRDAQGDYPFVTELVRLAQDARAILGGATKITYGADWSEYSGHQPQDGSGDVRFHLDPLWASPAIDAVGIDNYFPLSDWRDEDHQGGNPDGAAAPCDVAALRRGIFGGEGHDWYYASAAERDARLRKAIEDGAYGKHWVFRCKDLKGWWENRHYERTGGVEQSQPTAWEPCSKPIWFTELGCAAIDKGPNQPNLFGDPKSAESGRPWFSSGGRDDFVQRAFLEAHQAAWSPAHPDFDTERNPVSPAYGARMVDPDRIYHWCWDIRPYPAFPLDRERWSDGGNWASGHWLNGRLSGAAIGDIIAAILADHGLPPADTSGISGMIAGYVIDRPGSARAAIEPLAEFCGIAARESGGLLTFFEEDRLPARIEAIDDWIAGEDGPSFCATREAVQELPGEVALHFRDPLQEYQQATVRQPFGPQPSAGGTAEIALPVSCERGRAEAMALAWLRRQHAARDRIEFGLPLADRRLRPGSVIRMPYAGGSAAFLATRIDEGAYRRIEARRIAPFPPVPEPAELPGNSAGKVQEAGPPLAIFLDLPCSGTQDGTEQFRIAAWCRPWRTLSVSASPESTGFVERTSITRAACIGIMETALAPGPVGRMDHANAILLRLLDGELASVSAEQLLNGANALAVQGGNGGWEIVQFSAAEEIDAGRWRLTGLLRGQAGTEDAMAAGALAGSLVILLNDGVSAAGLLAGEIGLERRWRVQPSGLLSTADVAAETVETGGVRALKPLAPVHLNASPQADGGLLLSWIRRGRIDADSWNGTEIPLGEETEAYRLRILAGSAILREMVLGEPQWLYPADLLAADRAHGEKLRMELCQLSAAIGEGVAAAMELP